MLIVLFTHVPVWCIILFDLYCHLACVFGSMYISNACTCLVYNTLTCCFRTFRGCGCGMFTFVFVGRADRSGSAVGFVGIIVQFVFAFVRPQQMQFHEVFAPLNFTIRVKQAQFAFETCSCAVVDHIWCNAALRVLRAETRLTVHRPLQVDGYNFTSHKPCIPWCMQTLRSVHRLSKQFE